MTENPGCQNQNYIFGKSQDRNEAIFGNNYGYGSEYHVGLVIYYNRS